MLRLPKVGWLLLAAGVLSLPSQAQAQFIISRGAFGPWGGYGPPNMTLWGPTYGGWGGPGLGFGGPGYPGWFSGGSGAGPFAGAFGTPGMPGMPGFGGGVSPVPRFQTEVVPGFGATDTPRMRATFYPAIPARPETDIQAARPQSLVNRAFIDMQLPSANAKVYLDGVLTMQTGPVRRFMTPALNPGSQYYFHAEVHWEDFSGENLIRLRKIQVKAGETTSVDFRTQ